MNIYYYLFYKLSGVLNKKGKNEWGPISAITFLISLNIGLTYINIFPVTGENFVEGHKTVLIIVGKCHYIHEYYPQRPNTGIFCNAC